MCGRESGCKRETGCVGMRAGVCGWMFWDGECGREGLEMCVRNYLGRGRLNGG